MADIISLERHMERTGKTSRREHPGLPANWSAQIIIFPGIRIEREESYVSSGVSIK